DPGGGRRPEVDQPLRRHRAHPGLPPRPPRDGEAAADDQDRREPRQPAGLDRAARGGDPRRRRPGPPPDPPPTPLPPRRCEYRRPRRRDSLTARYTAQLRRDGKDPYAPSTMTMLKSAAPRRCLRAAWYSTES